MRIVPRTRDAWLVLAARGLVVVLFATAAVSGHHLVRLLVVFALGVALILFVFRRKAPAASGSVYTSSADRVLPGGRQRPGQLSITTTAVVWTPNRGSARRGLKAVSIEALECRKITLERGVGVRDVFLTITPVEGETIRLLTRSNRHLKGSIESLDALRSFGVASAAR